MEELVVFALITALVFCGMSKAMLPFVLLQLQFPLMVEAPLMEPFVVLAVNAPAI
ncbi:hypothetical protein D3C81_2205960 [compost metagenome]